MVDANGGHQDAYNRNAILMLRPSGQSHESKDRGDHQ
jgi:hypothetical protein